MTQAPEITVILPTYNSCGVLRYSIQSVLDQRFSNFEVWVIGDGCTDETQDLVASFKDPRLNWYNLKTNSGSQPAPNNEGLRRAKGKYIAYMGHDDLWMPWHLETLYQHATKTDADFCTPIQIAVAPDRICYITAQSYFLREPNNCTLPPEGWFHKKTLLNKVGSWNETYYKISNPPDLDLLNRIRKSNAKMISVPVFSVLKFPSAEWNSYSKKENLEEALKNNLIKIQKDANAFQIELLNRAAFEWSIYFPPILRKKQGFWMVALSYYISKAITLYGKNRFPMKQILHSRYLKRRRSNKKKRGLI